MIIQEKVGYTNTSIAENVVKVLFPSIRQITGLGIILGSLGGGRTEKDDEKTLMLISEQLGTIDPPPWTWQKWFQ